MFDIIVLSVVGISTAFAYLRGGLQEAATLLCLAVAAGLGWLLTEPVLGILSLKGNFLATIGVAGALIALLFIGAHIGCHIGLKRYPLNKRGRQIDQIAGAVFGATRGLVLIGLGYLGYAYYLDEAGQPESVRNALTRPVAAAVASGFEAFAPASTRIDDIEATSSTAPTQNAAQSGYDRADRNGLDEIVTTVTTDGADPEIADDAKKDEDDIADILQSEEQ